MKMSTLKEKHPKDIGNISEGNYECVRGPLNEAKKSYEIAFELKKQQIFL